MSTVEKTGKTVEDALAAALAELGVEAERVEYEILEAPSKGLFGLIGAKPARVKVSLKKIEPAEAGKNFLQELFAAMGVAVTLREQESKDGVLFDLCGEDLGILIGKHGQTLDALQYLTNLAANRGLTEGKIRIALDVENYRKRREETLYKLAARLADRVKRHGERVVLEPMSRNERKIIHIALQEDKRILTYSEGEEPFRKVVIAPKR